MELSRIRFCIVTILTAGLFISLSVIYAHAKWTTTFGGLGDCYIWAIRQTSDGGISRQEAPCHWFRAVKMHGY